jgi:hypothetical protein
MVFYSNNVREKSGVFNPSDMGDYPILASPDIREVYCRPTYQKSELLQKCISSLREVFASTYLLKLQKWQKLRPEEIVGIRSEYPSSCLKYRTTQYNLYIYISNATYHIRDGCVHHSVVVAPGGMMTYNFRQTIGFSWRFTGNCKTIMPPGAILTTMHHNEKAVLNDSGIEMHESSLLSRSSSRP